MKKIIKKIKNFFANSTPVAKLKYGIITVLTVAVAVSVIAIVAMNTNEAEIPNNPESGSTQSATIEFENEIVIDIVDTSDSDTETDTNTSSETKAEITTHESEPTEETTEKVTEAATEKETVKESEKTTEKIPSDPQSTPSQDEPKPTETKAEPTPVITTDKQTSPKPAETTVKQTTPAPKPAETTVKQTEAVTKPAETTTKQTEANTQPVEQPPKPMGQFILKEKKYEYKGADVSILHVENKSQKAYSVTLKATYKDASGKILKTESQIFEGFPANWSNYFVFQPGIRYDSISFELKTKEYSQKTYANYIEIYGSEGTVRMNWINSDGSGEIKLPTSPEEEALYPKYVAIYLNVINQAKSTYSKDLIYSGKSVFFDSNGDICVISSDSAVGLLNPGTMTFGTLILTDVLWENRDQYTIPDNLNSVTGICAITSVAEY